MNLFDFVKSGFAAGKLWDGQYKIPWDEPEFSRRMLAYHLSQEHDLASRRTEAIESQVEWIQGHILENRPSKILDLGCGPGLYSHRLSGSGHTCRAIDFSPASIEYAEKNNSYPDRCEFVHGDIRTAEYGNDFDAVLIVYGEFNAFPRGEILSILRKAYAALRDGGRILIEAHTPEQIERSGRAPGSWYKAESGLFSERPHICLSENVWHEPDHAAETSFYIVDAETGEVTLYRNTLRGYSPDDYRAILSDAEFDDIEILPAWDKKEIELSDALLLIRARK